MDSKINEGTEAGNFRTRTENIIAHEKPISNPAKYKTVGRPRLNDSPYRRAVVANTGRLQSFLEFECQDKYWPEDVAQNVVLKMLKREKTFVHDPQVGTYPQ